MEKEMVLVRLVTLETSEKKEDIQKARKIRARQRIRTMKKYRDSDKYVCYDENEYKSWQSKKVGRPIKE